MSIDFERLKSMSLEELRVLAIQQGMTPHHRTKEANLIKQIIEHVNKPPVQAQQPMQHPAEKKSSVAVMNTEDEVRTACENYFAKDGFIANFSNDTWHFRYKGAEDSGHMSTPLRVIRMKAGTVAQGARKPIIVKNELGQEVMIAGR